MTFWQERDSRLSEPLRLSGAKATRESRMPIPEPQPTEQRDGMATQISSETAPANPQKQRTGLNRVAHAGRYSLSGLRAGWHETAFRQEAIAAIILFPVAFWLGRNWTEIALLLATLVLVLIVELLNTGIETTIDRIGPQWHELSKRAKDVGSAAVLLSLLLCAGTWGAAIYVRMFL